MIGLSHIYSTSLTQHAYWNTQQVNLNLKGNLKHRERSGPKEQNSGQTLSGLAQDSLQSFHYLSLKTKIIACKVISMSTILRTIHHVHLCGIVHFHDIKFSYE